MMMHTRTPKTWAGYIATVTGVLLAGSFAGTALFHFTGSPAVVAALWAAVGVGLSLLWGARVAVLFVFPSSTAFVTGVLLGTNPVAAEFYPAAAQVAPVLLLALGLEQWSLRHEAKTKFEMTLFMVLLAYITLAVGAALYGSAVCDGAADGCVDVMTDLHVFPKADFVVTAANLAAAGIAGGLAAIPGLQHSAA